MKKFISMVMAAAMVVSLVPATAFAANEGTFKVVSDMEITSKVAEGYDADEAKGLPTGPQIQIKIKDVDANASKLDSYDVKLHIDNAEFVKATAENKLNYDWVKKGEVLTTAYVVEDEEDTASKSFEVKFAKSVEAGDDTVELTIWETSEAVQLADGDIIVIGLPAGTLGLTKTSAGTEATVKVTGDFGASDEMTFVSVLDKGITVDVDDTVDVAVEEVAELEDVTIEPAVGDTFGEFLADGDEITLKLSKGFEFANDVDAVDFTAEDIDGNETKGQAKVLELDDNEMVLRVGPTFRKATEVVFTNLKVEAVTAKEGDVCTLSVKADDCDSVKVEVATVCEFKVVMEVEEDEDLPTFYNGVNVANKGLTVDDDHETLEVTLKETFAGAWSNHKDFTLTLPEGVHVVAVDADDEGGKWADIQADFEAAYREGDHESFVFEKRTFSETDPDTDDAHEINFVLTLVADPDFVGDVVLTLEGDAVDTQEVTIAKVLAPFTVTAAQNDLKIDYRYTEVGTDIVITEAEAGLWEKDMWVELGVEDGLIDFEDDAVVTVNEDSEMEIDDDTDTKAGTIKLTVDEESDEVAAVVTISGIQLFMQRNIPAGAYDLEVVGGTTFTAFEAEKLFAPDCDGADNRNDDGECKKDDHECWVADVADYSEVVKEGWINIVTAGREADDASFTTKVVVPVGEAYIIAGEAQVALDVPAYVNAAGYTMLPVRAVAVALGINTQNVLWDQATKTVTILYGQRIITMQVGAKVVYVNGSAIPASASVEIVDGRTFLPMRDLATALGVTDITWDAATKTATLNGNA